MLHFRIAASIWVDLQSTELHTYMCREVLVYWGAFLGGLLLTLEYRFAVLCNFLAVFGCSLHSTTDAASDVAWAGIFLHYWQWILGS